jgi:2-polyprenyl-6-hydroxyphenyl methylase/3-demethylubiquinone-9 3-methyltransferase
LHHSLSLLLTPVAFVGIFLQIGRERNATGRRLHQKWGEALSARADPLHKEGQVRKHPMDRPPSGAGTIDQEEVARFSRIAAQWWDPHGPMAALHTFNPVRLAYVRDRAAAHFHRDPTRLDSLAGLRILDIGCGGGILSEPLARLGAAVVGADPSESNIAVARRHAEQSGLAIDYRCTTAEALAEAAEVFDVVLAMEVVEHVADVGLFVELAAAMVKPGGLLFVATLNRTAKSFALAIVGAEYILRWLPRGTHQWDKFVTPNELEIAIQEGELRIIAETGVIYNLFADRWQLGADMDVNYMMVAEKAA